MFYLHGHLIENCRRYPFHINTENIHSGTHLQVPVMADLSSHSSARTWIRSVSYPEQSGNSVVHFENESEPLIKVQAIFVTCVSRGFSFLCLFYHIVKMFCSCYFFILISSVETVLSFVARIDHV